MDSDVGDLTMVEERIFVIDIEDDELERVAAGGGQPITWAYCTAIWYGCPV